MWKNTVFLSCKLARNMGSVFVPFFKNCVSAVNSQNVLPGLAKIRKLSLILCFECFANQSTIFTYHWMQTSQKGYSTSDSSLRLSVHISAMPLMNSGRQTISKSSDQETSHVPHRLHSCTWWSGPLLFMACTSLLFCWTCLFFKFKFAEIDICTSLQTQH